MIYKEWEDLKTIEDEKNPFSVLFEYPDGTRFYIEPIFYTKLISMIDHHKKEKNRILEAMKVLVKEHKKVIFTGSFVSPCTNENDYIYVELEDITNKLQIFVKDKSRGSDYGD